MASLVENVNSVIEIFNASKSALTEKGVDVSEHAIDIPSEIASIPSGGNNAWFGTVTIANDASLTPVEVDTGLKNITKVMWFGTNGGTAAGTFRNRQCGMWDSSSNKVTALRTGLNTSNTASATVTNPTLNIGGSLANIVNIHTMDAANGKFSFKAAANTNAYWATLYVIAIAENNPTPMLLSEEV